MSSARHPPSHRSADTDGPPVLAPSSLCLCQQLSLHSPRSTALVLFTVAMAPQIVPTVPVAVMHSAASSFSSSSSTSLEPLYTTTVIETVYASATAQSSSSASKAGTIASAAAALAQGDIGGGGEAENVYLSFAEIGELEFSLHLEHSLICLLQALSSPPSSLRHLSSLS